MSCGEQIASISQKSVHYVRIFKLKEIQLSFSSSSLPASVHHVHLEMLLLLSFRRHGPSHLGHQPGGLNS